jgi:hypothetical protein
MSLLQKVTPTPKSPEGDLRSVANSYFCIQILSVGTGFQNVPLETGTCPETKFNPPLGGQGGWKKSQTNFTEPQNLNSRENRGSEKLFAFVGSGGQKH